MMTPTFSMWLWVALGGAAGSVARMAIALSLPSRFPWAVLAINVAGSALIGWLMGRLGVPTAENLRWHALAVAGFCGGFTTFSTFSWQTFEQLQKGQTGAALLNVGLSVGLCLLATWAGFRLGR